MDRERTWQSPSERLQRRDSSAPHSEWGAGDPVSPQSIGRWRESVATASTPDAGAVTSSTPLPSGRQEAYQKALAYTGDKAADTAWSLAPGAMDTSATLSMALSGLDRERSLQEAKELAKLRAQSSEVSPWSMISQGVGMLGSIAGSFSAPAPSVPSSSSAFPSYSSSASSLGFIPRAWGM